MCKTLLRLLMTVCSLGAEWKNPTKIPVDAIIEEWRVQSSRGRYEGHQWSAAALAEITGAPTGSDGAGGSTDIPNGGLDGGSGGGGGGGGGSGGGGDNRCSTTEHERLAEVDGREAAGLFAWLGR